MYSLARDRLGIPLFSLGTVKVYYIIINYCTSICTDRSEVRYFIGLHVKNQGNLYSLRRVRLGITLFAMVSCTHWQE